jgi:hypothetical protein
MTGFQQIEAAALIAMTLAYTLPWNSSAFAASKEVAWAQRCYKYCDGKWTGAANETKKFACYRTCYKGSTVGTTRQ